MKYFLIVSLLWLAGCDTRPPTQVLFTSEPAGEVACYRIPSLVTAPDGTLIAVCDQRVPSCADLKGNRDINIVMRTSTDYGETWSDLQVIVDYPEGRSASDPSMIVDRTTGTVFLFFNYMDHDQEKGIYYLRVMKSTDNGKTWSTPEDITDQITKPDWHGDFKFITSGRGMQTKSGKLVHTLVNLQKGLHLFGSDDHGRSWYLLDVPITPGDESKVIELADGTWMVNSRGNGAGHRYVHLSADEGKTWGEGSTVHAGNSAYSSMTFIPGKGIGLLYERNDYREIVFTRINP